MATTFRDLNRTTDNTGDYGSRQVFNLSNGNVISVMRDDNTGGDQRLYVYETADRATWTLRATITPWTASPARIAASVDSADNLHIICFEVGTKQTIKYCKMTYSGYSVGAWETVFALSNDNEFHDFDIDVADNGQIFVSAIYWKGTSSPYGFYVFTKVGSSWNNTGGVVLHSAGWNAGCESISVISSGIQTISSIDHNVVFVAVGYSQGKTDQGVKIYRTAINPTDGSLNPDWTSSSAAVGTYAKGEGNPSSTFKEGRLVRFFRDMTDVNTIYLGIMHAEVNRKMSALQFSTVVGQTTLTTAEANATNSSKASDIGSRYMGMTIGGDTLQFFYGVSVTTFPVRTVKSFSAHRQDDGTFAFAPRNAWYLKNGYITNQSVTLIPSGGQRNGRSTLGDIVISTSRSSTNRKWYHECIRIADFEAPTVISPADGSSSTSSNPQIYGRLKYASSYMPTAMTLQFQLATDAAFADLLTTFNSDGFTIIDNVDSATGTTGVMGGTVPDSSSITPNTTIYLHARTVDDMGNSGPWSTAISFTVAHPPTATNLKPADGAVIQAGDSDTVQFSWGFNDTSQTDTQGAYNVKIFDASDALILDTGDVSSDAKFDSESLAGYVDVQLSWSVALTDNWGSKGPFTTPQSFRLEDPPTVTITSPIVGEDIGTPVAHVDLTVATSGGGTIRSYRVVITQGRTTVYDTGYISRPNDPSGSTYSIDSPGQVLHNLGQYTVTAYAIDNRGFQGKSDPVSFSASWTPPAMPTTVPVIDLTNFSVEGQGFVTVTWDDSGKDTNFVLYVLQRKDDMIDTVSGAVQVAGVWKDIATIYDNDTTYEYHDYLAPATNYQVSYRVVQGATIFNDVVLSDPGPAASDFPESGEYWLVDPDLADGFSGAMLIHNVTADSYTEEYETETYHVIGRGNHVDYGDRLGYNGSVTAQLRNSGGTSARSKKIALETLRSNRRSLYLRTPFGDVKLVSMGDVQVSRIAGVGIDEFCDVTIPYQEVSG